MSHPS